MITDAKSHNQLTEKRPLTTSTDGVLPFGLHPNRDPTADATGYAGCPFYVFLVQPSSLSRSCDWR